MKIQEEIELLLLKRCGGNSRHSIRMRRLFDSIRGMERPLTLWQHILVFFGFHVNREKVLTDEDFLAHLKLQERINPIPEMAALITYEEVKRRASKS